MFRRLDADVFVLFSVFACKRIGDKYNVRTEERKKERKKERKIDR
jgi:hypothetical protein